jgi:predicted NAD/FAD-binding protein
VNISAAASPHASPRQRIAVIGGGVAGLSAAWLLSQAHDVTLFEADGRLGGHANTVIASGAAGEAPVDTGFIVYNEPNYPNFTALLDWLGVASQPADMALSVSLDDGAFEYSSYGALGLFAQTSNLFSTRFWAMLRDVGRFYRHGPKDLAGLEAPLTSLEAYLEEKGYCQAFRDDHLLPQAAAIWSTPLSAIREYPAAALIRFFQNHGMMSVFGRGLWRTVSGGSQTYVRALSARFRGVTRVGVAVAGVRREAAGVAVEFPDGSADRFDAVVLATHADTALGLLKTPTAAERRLLPAFRYSQNTAVLHTDPALMPKRRRAWTSWNHIGRRDAPHEGCVTYWMNRLQGLPRSPDLFVTLNPSKPLDPAKVIRTDAYDHPLFDAGAIAAQRQLWDLQGADRIWYCGSYFGHGFHEDALQAGLAVAEQLGGVRRPWTVAEESGRIHVSAPLEAAA